MKYEYTFFILHGAPYLPDERRAAQKAWLNKLGADGWEVVALLPQRESEAGAVAWVKRPIPDPVRDAGPELLVVLDAIMGLDGRYQGLSIAERAEACRVAYYQGEKLLRKSHKVL